MDGARLQQVIDKGYRISARNVGNPFRKYRPSGLLAPVLVSGNEQTGTVAAFTPASGGEFAFTKPIDHSVKYYSALLDRDGVAAADYFVNAVIGTYCVIGLPQIAAPLAIRCDSIVSISRPVGATSIGLGGYQGSVPATEVPVLTGWPVSLNEAGKAFSARGGGSDHRLPDSVGTAKFELIVPPWPGLVLRSADIVVDEHLIRYVVEVAGSSHLGWKCRVMQETV